MTRFGLLSATALWVHCLAYTLYTYTVN